MNGVAMDALGRRLWVGINGLELDADTARHLGEIRPGGIVLFRRNIDSLQQCRRLTASLRDLLGSSLHVAVDQEGGLVERFRGLLPSFPGNMALASLGVRDPAMAAHLAREQGRLLGLLLRDLGINVNFAPALDLAVTGANPSTGLRSFGCHAALAGALGAAFIEGERRAGILPCGKHFPGLGAAEVDSHLDLPLVKAGPASDALAPFRAAIAAGVPLMMTSHVVYEGLDPDAPATFSRAIVHDLLREELGFKGVTVSDDLEMGAMQRRFSFADVVRRAAQQHDVLCICASAELQRDALKHLRAGVECDAAAAAAHKASLARIETLPPWSSPAGEDLASITKEAESVAEAIAGRAISVLRDDRRLLPLRGAVLVILPVRDAGSPVEDPLRGESDAQELIRALGDGARALELPARPDAAAIAAAVQRAEDAEALVLVVTAATFRIEQQELLRAVLARRPETVVVALRSPFDLAAAASCAAATLVASHGFRPLQLRALASVLRGQTKSYGRLAIALGSSS